MIKKERISYRFGTWVNHDSIFIFWWTIPLRCDFVWCVFNAPAGSYIPEGLMTSCTWDYVSPSPTNKSYTMMLCCFVFFIPLAIILYCYLFMFLSVRKASRSELLEASSNWRVFTEKHLWLHEWCMCECVFRDLERLSSQKSSFMKQQSMKSEWKLAKIAAVVIVVYVLCWAPYACITLIAWAGWVLSIYIYRHLYLYISEDFRFTWSSYQFWKHH